MSNPEEASHVNAIAMAQLAEVRGQLSTITQLLTINAKHTDQRIDDLRHAMEGRMTGHDSRLSKLETNERGTAIRTAGVAAVTSTIVAAGIAALKSIGH